MNPMKNRNEELKEYLVPGKHVHLVGIGGVSMRPLGLVLKGMGLTVTGSDMTASASTDELISKGIHVTIGHQAENIDGADCVIRTAAAHNDNPEIAACRSKGVPMFERAQAWGVIMKAYKKIALYKKVGFLFEQLHLPGESSISSICHPFAKESVTYLTSDGDSDTFNAKWRLYFPHNLLTINHQNTHELV